MNQGLSKFSKKILWVFVFSPALYACANTGHTVRATKSIADKHVQQLRGSGAIPMQLINGLPHIAISINGQGPYLFGFDSGFGAAMELDTDLAAQLGVKATDKTTIGDGSGKTVVLDMGVVSMVEIGKQTMQQVKAIIRSSPRKLQPGMEQVKGIIGIGMFSTQKLTIDYPQLLFSVENGSLPSANDKNIFDFTPVGGGVPEIDIQVGGMQVRAVIDSRSMSAEFKIPQQIAEKLTRLTEPKVIGKGRTVSSTIDIIEVKIKESIQVGEYIYNEPVITYPSLNENAIIGSKFLKNFIVTIDSKNKRIQLTKGKEPKVTPAVNGGDSKDNNNLAQYTGKYAGERVITAEAGFLYMKRAAGSVLKMLPIGKDEFTIEVAPNSVLKFERGDNDIIVAVKVTKGDGNWETAVKEN